MLAPKAPSIRSLGQHKTLELAKSLIQQGFLLFLVQMGIANSRRSRGRAPGIAMLFLDSFQTNTDSGVPPRKSVTPG